VFIGYPLGPILGGWLLDTFWWGSVFLINVPVIVIALTAVAVLMPESRSEQRPRIDVAGVVISSLGLTSLVYGFIKAGQDGWGDVTVLATIAGGVAILAGFVLWERRVARRPGGQPDPHPPAAQPDPDPRPAAAARPAHDQPRLRRDVHHRLARMTQRTA